MVTLQYDHVGGLKRENGSPGGFLLYLFNVYTYLNLAMMSQLAAHTQCSNMLCRVAIRSNVLTLPAYTIVEATPSKGKEVHAFKFT